MPKLTILVISSQVFVVITEIFDELFDKKLTINN